MSGETVSLKRPASPQQEDIDKCTVCFEAFGREEKVLLQCGHTFHGLCAQTWYKSQHPCLCPLCRSDFDIVKFVTDGAEHPETEEWRSIRESAMLDDARLRLEVDLQFFFLQLFADALRGRDFGMLLDTDVPFPHPPRRRRQNRPRAPRNPAQATTNVIAAAGAAIANVAATAQGQPVAAAAAAGAAGAGAAAADELTVAHAAMGSQARPNKRRRVAHRDTEDDDDSNDMRFEDDPEDQDYRPASRTHSSQPDGQAPRRGRSRGRLE